MYNREKNIEFGYDYYVILKTSVKGFNLVSYINLSASPLYAQ